MKEGDKIKREVIRVAGKLKEVVSVKDEAGKVIHKMVNPLMVEFYTRDLLQIIVGASILAIPVAFTEETWNLGQTMPLLNVGLIFLISLTFISAFVFYNFYRGKIKNHKKEFLKRVLSIYFVSFVIVALLLTIIERAPWNTDLLLALKRTILVTFPASMSAAVSDMIK